jgi:hypothetical protein
MVREQGRQRFHILFESAQKLRHREVVFKQVAPKVKRVLAKLSNHGKASRRYSIGC